MSNSYFQFKQFIVYQDKCAMKVTTDGCLFGAWIAEKVQSSEFEVHSSASNYVLDIGTGTGLLSLMLEQKNPELEIDAIEIDEDAAGQATENVGSSPWKERINIINADVKTYPFRKKYGIIISNPPFYDRELKGEESKRNLAHHNEGLLHPELLDIINSNLGQDGSWYLLLPYKRNEEIRKTLIDHELNIEQITFVRQSVNHDYFRMMISGKLKTGEPVETIINEIAIKDAEGLYTFDFTRLLKDYYLHL